MRSTPSPVCPKLCGSATALASNTIDPDQQVYTAYREHQYHHQLWAGRLAHGFCDKNLGLRVRFSRNQAAAEQTNFRISGGVMTHLDCSSVFRPAVFAALVGTLALLLGGCEPVREPLPNSFDAANVDSFCRDWARLRNADFLYENNVWGQGTIKRENRLQCLLRRIGGGKIQYGWRWQWPRGSGEVKAYPEVIYGHKPWLSTSTTGALPRQVSEIEELSVTYDIEMRAQGRYNLAFDIWVTNSDRPTPTAITHEIMIWVGERADAGEPYPGKRVKRVMIGGAAYDLYVKSHAEWLAEHGAPNVVYIAFNARTARLSGGIDIKEFLDYLTENGHLPAEGFVASVELGNEVMHGTGELWFKTYEISVN